MGRRPEGADGNCRGHHSYGRHAKQRSTRGGGIGGLSGEQSVVGQDAASTGRDGVGGVRGCVPTPRAVGRAAGRPRGSWRPEWTCSSSDIRPATLASARRRSSLSRRQVTLPIAKAIVSEITVTANSAISMRPSPRREPRSPRYRTRNRQRPRRLRPPGCLGGSPERTIIVAPSMRLLHLGSIPACGVNEPYRPSPRRSRQSQAGPRPPARRGAACPIRVVRHNLAQ